MATEPSVSSLLNLTPTFMNDPLHSSPCRSCEGRGLLPRTTYYSGLGLSPVTFCPHCPAGRRQKRQWSLEPKQRDHQFRLKIKKIRHAKGFSSLSPIYQEARLEDFTEQADLHAQLLGYVQAWPKLKVKGQGLYLYGSASRLKTRVLSALGHEIERQHLSAWVYLTLPELLSRLEVISSSMRRFYSAVRPFIDAELLLLDDLGLHTPSQRQAHTLRIFLELRRRSRRPLISAGILSPRGIEKRYGVALSRLILERAHFISLEERE